MTESERKDYQRLKAAGRWSQAREFREAERKRLRSAGHTKQQACDDSWALMLQKYSPASTSRPPAELLPQPIDPNTLPDVVFAEALDYRAMVKWTLGAIGLDPDRIPTRQVPSPACLVMQRMTQSDKGRERFFALVKQQEEEDAEKAKVQRSFEDDKQKHFKLFDKILEDLERRKKLGVKTISTAPDDRRI